MPVKQEYLDFILGQLDALDGIRILKMFGGATLYCDQMVVGLITDDQLYIKPTHAGRSFIGNCIEAAPYPGAKDCFLIDERQDDPNWLCELVLKTAMELPKPKKG